MLIVKSFHLIAIVAWFAGLFYLPRLFVYHANTKDEVSVERFKVMERRLYRGIMWPAAVAVTFLGCLLISYNLPYYLTAGWMHVKFLCVLLLWSYHFYCGYFLKQFANDRNVRSAYFFRVFNEIPTLFLIVIILLAVTKPF